MARKDTNTLAKSIVDQAIGEKPMKKEKACDCKQG